jgi:hypothetical protein
LKGWAEEGHWTELQAFAARLLYEVDAFDVDRLPGTLQEFTAVVQKLAALPQLATSGESQDRIR